MLYVSKVYDGSVYVVLGPFAISSRNALKEELRNLVETCFRVLWVVLRKDRVTEFRVYRNKMCWISLGWVGCRNCTLRWVALCCIKSFSVGLG